MTALATVGFDADDTLWQNEYFYKLTQARFAELLAGHAAPGDLSQRLLETEKRNAPTSCRRSRREAGASTCRTS